MLQAAVCARRQRRFRPKTPLAVGNDAQHRPTMSPIRVAAIQAASVSYDLPASLAKLRTLVATAAAGGAALAVLPEAFLSAYPRHLAFRIGYRIEEDREWFGKYVEVGRIDPCENGRS